MKNWWKYLAAALLLYVAVYAFLHPMIPGAMTVNTDVIRPGENKFEFVGYNTHFQSKSDSLTILVSCDNHHYYCATATSIPSENHLFATVILPDTIPTSKFTFYVNNPLDGTVHFEAPTQSEGFAIVEKSTQGTCSFKVNSDDHREFGFPFQPIIIESIRNLMWHVPMWFTMFTLMIISFIMSLRALMKPKGDLRMEDIHARIAVFDRKAAAAASVGMIFCVLGLITGSVWARFTWLVWWINDPQLNGAMVVFIVYAAYFILRSAVEDSERKARLSAIFNIFAFVLMVVLLMVMPRFTEGLHPGKSGNPAFSKYDLDSSLRSVFYPACAGFILLGYWMYNLKYRINLLQEDEKNAATID